MESLFIKIRNDAVQRESVIEYVQILIIENIICIAETNKTGRS